MSRQKRIQVRMKGRPPVYGAYRRQLKGHYFWDIFGGGEIIATVGDMAFKRDFEIVPPGEKQELKAEGGEDEQGTREKRFEREIL